MSNVFAFPFINHPFTWSGYTFRASGIFYPFGSPVKPGEGYVEIHSFYAPEDVDMTNLPNEFDRSSIESAILEDLTRRLKMIESRN